MITLGEYILFVVFMLPAFSGMTCGSLAIMSIGDSQSHTEIKLKCVLSCYLFMAAFAWFGSFTFSYLPKAFVYLNAFIYLSFLSLQVLFYHFFFILTQIDENEKFNRWHYAFPVIISLVLLIWSFFVPFEVQLDIVKARNTYMPEGYESYTRFFFSKPEMRFLYGLIYVTLTLFRLRKHYHTINQDSGMVRKPQRWVWFLVLLMLTSLVNSLLGTLLPRKVVLESYLMIFSVSIIFCQHIVITYHVIRRQFLLYVVVSEPIKQDKTIATGHIEPEPADKEKHYDEPLTAKVFEAYIRKEKPYLKKGFKMTDLEEVFGTNRTYISNFINETYGMNFNRLINRMRLKEMEGLQKRPSNAGKTPAQLIQKAGFSDIRHYNRALAAESAVKEVTDSVPEKDNSE